MREKEKVEVLEDDEHKEGRDFRVPNWLRRDQSVLFWASLSPALGQLSYTLISIGALTNICLELFRYDSASGFYDNGDISGTNYWKIANSVRSYGGLSIWSLAALMQFLSLFGLFPTANMMVWEYGVGFAGQLIFLTYTIIQYIAYEDAHSNITSSDSVKSTRAPIVKAAAKSEFYEALAIQAGLSVAAASQFQNWLFWQWELLPAEERKA